MAAAKWPVPKGYRIERDGERDHPGAPGVCEVVFRAIRVSSDGEAEVATVSAWFSRRDEWWYVESVDTPAVGRMEPDEARGRAAAMAWAADVAEERNAKIAAASRRRSA